MVFAAILPCGTWPGQGQFSKGNGMELDQIIAGGRILAASTVLATLIAGPLGAQDGAPVARTVMTGGGALAFLEAGNGPAVVIVHGIGGHKEDWTGVMAALAPTHRVYAIDMLGFGGSARLPADLTMGAQAGAVRDLLLAEGVAKADLLGNSVGGWVTATFAASYPDMTGKLVLVDPAGFAAMFDGEPPVNLFPDTVEQMKALLEYVLASDFAHTDEFAAQAFAAFEAGGEKAVVPTLFPALVASPKLEEILPKVTASTLVVWGKEDRLFPVALAPYITSLVPGATSVIIEAASHFPQIDNPAEFNAAVLGFLAD